MTNQKVKEYSSSYEIISNFYSKHNIFIFFYFDIAFKFQIFQ